jgi:hypothetical protein
MPWTFIQIVAVYAVCANACVAPDETPVIRLLFRLGFWALVAGTVVPSVRYFDVFADGFDAQAAGVAMKRAYQDISTLCRRNPSFCRVTNEMTTAALEEGKARLLIAYQGVRTQFDAPGRRATTTGAAKD